jgi:hypothetical protein
MPSEPNLINEYHAKGAATMTDATHHTPTRLQFLSDWRIIQHSNILPGEKLIVEYDVGRLPNFRWYHAGMETWFVEIYIHFLPGGQLQEGFIVRRGHTPTIDHPAKPFEILVPMDATQVELWFRTYDLRGREAWDSQFGRNYWFDVARV